MAVPPGFRPHGVATRGIDLAPKSVLYEGRFGRIFRSIPAADFGDADDETQANLALLASKMVAGADPVKDGPDGEESGIPAVFTYFGQFIDHDLTFDPVSSLQRQNDPDALVNFRTPAFDLDCIYGRGPNDQPYLYDADGTSLSLGVALTGKAAGTDITARDVLRVVHPADLPDPDRPRRALIGDPRNDENVIVSQLQGLVLRFHNRVVQENPGLKFTDIQRIVRFHYQWVVINDFLPRIVAERVLHSVLPHLRHHTDPASNPPDLKFFHPRNTGFIPLEFAAAAYRMGHSMVRPGYRLNDDTLQPIFPFAGSGGEGNPDILPGLTGFGHFPTTWAMDWSRFIDLTERPAGDENKPGTDPSNRTRLQLAYRLDASLVAPLGVLPHPRVVDDTPPLNSLAARNLLRGWRMRLPSGQAIARAIGVDPLPDEEIQLGKEQDDASADNPRTPVASLSDRFKDNCPLWVYVLAEAAHEYRKHGHKATVHVQGMDRKVGTPQLGDVGGRIVAETFAGLLLKDPNSYFTLFPKFRPTVHGDPSKPFGLREFVKYALGG